MESKGTPMVEVIKQAYCSRDVEEVIWLQDLQMNAGKVFTPAPGPETSKPRVIQIEWES